MISEGLEEITVEEFVEKVESIKTTKKAVTLKLMREHHIRRTYTPTYHINDKRNLNTVGGEFARIDYV